MASEATRQRNAATRTYSRLARFGYGDFQQDLCELFFQIWRLLGRKSFPEGLLGHQPKVHDPSLQYRQFAVLWLRKEGRVLAS